MKSTMTMIGVSFGSLICAAITQDDRFVFCAELVAVAAVVNLAMYVTNQLFRGKTTGEQE